MAFQTVPGSSAPTGTVQSYLGTTGVDAITLTNKEGPVFLSARQADDVISVQSFRQAESSYSLNAGAGNDTIQSLAPNTAPFTFVGSFLAANDGNDTININAASGTTVQGNENIDQITVFNVTASVINGNQNNDVLNIGAAAAANGTVSGGSIFGGQGTDTINLNADLTTGSFVRGNDDLDNISIGAGTAVNVNNTVVNGNGGNDRIFFGGVGNLTTFANSTIFGGAGNDSINSNAAGNAAGNLGGNFNVTTGFNAETNDGNDVAFGGTGADTLSSSAGNDTLTSGAGNDTITTEAGNSALGSGAGNDIITAGAGTDTINGGTGTDTVTAGGGNDAINYADNTSSGGTFNDGNNAIANGDILTFTNNRVDVITDFNVGDTLTATGNAGATTNLIGVAGNNAGNTAYSARGTFNANGTFTFGAAGNDMLLANGDGANALNAAGFSGFLVLQGFGAINGANVIGAGTVL